MITVFLNKGKVTERRYRDFLNNEIVVIDISWIFQGKDLNTMPIDDIDFADEWIELIHQKINLGINKILIMFPETFLYVSKIKEIISEIYKTYIRSDREIYLVTHSRDVVQALGILTWKDEEYIGTEDDNNRVRIIVEDSDGRHDCYLNYEGAIYGDWNDPFYFDLDD